MNKRWVIAPVEPALAATLARELALPPPVAQCLINRGYREVEAARHFLNPQLRHLGDPFALPDMAAAVDRILIAIDQKQRIAIYGDYDVDGVTSSAFLTRVLRAAGATVENFLPLRMEEGYGLSADGVARCLAAHHPDLLIAVDCGTSSRAEIAGLNRQGVAVIVLDHHEPPAQLPECVALVNPKRVPDSPLQVLASVGVAFKLAHALLKQRRELADRIDLREHLDLVAIGTVADIVPLTGENRLLVKTGLERAALSNKIGLRALMEVAGVDGPLTPYHVGFRLGPRLNAAGRLAAAMAALELLLTDNEDRAAELAESLNDHNLERQQIEERIVQQALEMARAQTQSAVIVVANDDWHTGVIGIVASRITQQFYRPAVVIGKEGKGSCRSIAGFSIVGALTGCAELLVRFGGHEMAAGLSIEPANVSKLCGQLNEYATRALPAEALVPTVKIDATVTLAELDEVFLKALERMEPCGAGNPTPVFAALALRLRGTPRVVGKKHLKFQLTNGNQAVDAIWWGMGAAELPAGPLDAAFVPERNEYAGRTTLQLKVRDLRPAAL
jgi:single-stranded-DNA-specific exonuclease